MVAMEIAEAVISNEENMATAASQRPLLLLRRPLPPKQPPPPTSLRSRTEDKSSETTDNYKVSAKSPDVLTVKRFTNTKSKVEESTMGEVRFHGDVPLPMTSVVKPYKPKGPDPLPPRPPRKLRELPLEAFINDSYTRPPPEFTLKDFARRLPSRTKLDDDGEPMISEQNYEKLTSWFAANKPHQSTIHSLEIDSSVDVPGVTPRVPVRQLLIEMQFQGMDILPSPDQELTYITDHSATVFPVTPAGSKLTLPASRFAPLPPIETEHVSTGDGDALMSSERDHHRDTQYVPIKTFGATTEAETTTASREIGQEKPVVSQNEGTYRSKELRARFDQDQVVGDSKDQHSLSRGRNYEPVDNQRTAVKERMLTLEIEPMVAYQGEELILPSSQPEYFQGEELPRTSSPFVSADVYDAQMSPMEAVVLNAMMTGSSMLNLRAHFLSQLPDLSGLAGMLTHLNLSFNDLWVFPLEILQLVNLVTLKLRNNPIKEIPHDIKKLKRLIVFEISFNSLMSIPSSLFQLKHLEKLDLAYNRLTFISSDIANLSSLRELNLEGNQLGAMPVGALYLNLKYVKVNNNFMHPFLWRETATNQPQRLGDLSALAVFKAGLHIKIRNLPAGIKSIMERFLSEEPPFNAEDGVWSLYNPFSLSALGLVVLFIGYQWFFFSPNWRRDHHFHAVIQALCKSNYLLSYTRCHCCDGPMFGPGVRIIKAPLEIFGIKNLPFLFNACTQTCRRQFKKNPQSLSEWMKRNVPLNVTF